MKGAIIAGGATAILSVAINIVSDNLANPWAWVAFAVAILLAAFAGNAIDKKLAQRAKIRGESNEVKQDLSGVGIQTAKVKGKRNQVKQTIKK